MRLGFTLEDQHERDSEKHSILSPYLVNVAACEDFMPSDNKNIKNLCRIIIERAKTRPDHPLFSYLVEGEMLGQEITYSQLHHRAVLLATTLKKKVAKGRRVILLYPSGIEFICAFIACLYAKVVAVPLNVPRKSKHLMRLLSIVEDCSPTLVLTDEKIKKLFEGNLEEDCYACLKALEWLNTESAVQISPLFPINEFEFELEEASEEIAFIQYTSGSTSLPKGVMLSHQNLIANLQMMQAAFGMHEGSIGVSWLPLFHDMGLIGAILQGIYSGAHIYFMSPQSFIQKPFRWLKALSDFKAQYTVGPNFSLEHCVNNIKDEALIDIDLSNLKYFLLGSEIIRKSAIDSFFNKFEKNGFVKNAFCPVYGLAEATLFVTGLSSGLNQSLPKYFTFSKHENELNKVSSHHKYHETSHISEVSNDNKLSYIGNGKPWLAGKIIICHPDKFTICEPNEIGEVWVKGPHVGLGYWQKEQETKETFNAFTKMGEGPYLRTGDLGLFIEDELVITGRMKEIILIRGRNYYPHDLEQTAALAHTLLTPNAVIAFSVEKEQEEKLILVCEITRTNLRKILPEVIYHAILSEIFEQWEMSVEDIILVKPGQLPRTSSGKMQRILCRSLYLNHTLEKVGKSYLETKNAEENSVGIIFEKKEESITFNEVSVFLQQEIKYFYKVNHSINLTASFSALGLDSIKLIMLSARCESHFKINIDLSLWFETKTLHDAILAISKKIDQHNLLKEDKEDKEDKAKLVYFSDQDLSLSFYQKKIYDHQETYPESIAYHLPFHLTLTGKIDHNALIFSFIKLVNENRILRSFFQKIENEVKVNFHEENIWKPDFCVMEKNDNFSLKKEIEALSYKKFNLNKDRLIRVSIIKEKNNHDFIEDEVAESTVHVVMVFHHLIIDGGSFYVMLNQIKNYYASFFNKTKDESFIANHDYYNLVLEEKSQNEAKKEEAGFQYWQGLLHNKKPYLDWIQKRKKAVSGFDVEYMKVELSNNLSQAIKQFSHQSGYSIFNILLSGYQLFIAQLSQESDFCINVPVNSRKNVHAQSAIGFWVNTLLMPFSIEKKLSALSQLELTKINSLRILQCCSMSLENVVDSLKIKRIFSEEAPFSQLFFSAQDISWEDQESFLPGILLKNHTVFPLHAKFDLSLVFDQGLGMNDRPISGLLEWKKNLFCDQEWISWLPYYEQILFSFIAQFNEPKLPFVLDYLPQESLLRQAKKVPINIYSFIDEVQKKREAPDQPFIQSLLSTLSYHEFIDKTLILSAFFHVKNIYPQDKIVIFVSNWSNRLIALWACLQYQLTYIPIDNHFGLNSIEKILKKVRPKAIIFDADSYKVFSESAHFNQVLTLGLPFYAIEEAFNSSLRPWTVEKIKEISPLNFNYCVYIIFTSGSTGEPKGAGVTLKNISNLINWHRSLFNEKEKLSTLIVSSFAFDLTQKNLFTTFLLSGQLILMNSAFNITEVISLIKNFKPNHINCSPSVVNLILTELINEKLCIPFELIVLGGEPISSTLIDKIKSISINQAQHSFCLINSYGPTECTDVVLYKKFDFSFLSLTNNLKSITLGQSIPNVSSYILSKEGTWLPPFIEGELWLSGEAVGCGYIDDDLLNQKHFINNPWAEGLVYKTGDIVTYDLSCDITYVGRNDAQIKLRGIRVDLESLRKEILVLVEADDVYVEKNEDYLIAFIKIKNKHIKLLEEKKITKNELQEDFFSKIKKHLADYLMPNQIILLNEWPLNQNGKIDRSELKKQISFQVSQWVQPKTSWDIYLCNIISEMLKEQKVSMTDQFFKLGGSSLSAHRIIAKISREKGILLLLSDFYQYPTISALSEKCQDLELGKDEFNPQHCSLNFDALRLNSTQNSLFLLWKMNPSNTAYNITVGFIFNQKIDFSFLFGAVNASVARQMSLRAKFYEKDDQFYQTISAFENDDLNSFFFFSSVKNIVIADNFALNNFIQDEVNVLNKEPFDLLSGPLLRVKGYSFSEKKSAIIMSVHHIIFDGASVNLFFSCLEKEYINLATKNKDFFLHEKFENSALCLDISQKKLLQIEEEKKYWFERLKNHTEVRLPVDNLRLDFFQAKSSFISGCFDESIKKELEFFCLINGYSSYQVLLACFILWKKILTKSACFSFGIPVSIRTPKNINTIGCFINVIPFNIKVEDQSFYELLKIVSENLTNDLRYSDCNFDEILSGISIKRSHLVPFLIQEMFNYLGEQGRPSFSIDGQNGEVIYPRIAVPKYEWVLTLYENNLSLAWEVEYRNDCFNAEGVKARIELFTTLLTESLRSPNVLFDSFESGRSEHTIPTESFYKKYNVAVLDNGLENISLTLIEEKIKKIKGLKKVYASTNDIKNKKNWLLLISLDWQNVPFPLDWKNDLPAHYNNIKEYVTNEILGFLPFEYLPKSIWITDYFPGNSKNAMSARLVKSNWKKRSKKIESKFYSLINRSRQIKYDSCGLFLNGKFSKSILIKSAFKVIFRVDESTLSFSHKKNELFLQNNWKRILIFRKLTVSFSNKSALDEFLLKEISDEGTTNLLAFYIYQVSKNNNNIHYYIGVRVSNILNYNFFPQEILSRWMKEMENQSSHTFKAKLNTPNDRKKITNINILSSIKNSIKFKTKSLVKQKSIYDLSFSHLSKTASFFNCPLDIFLLGIYQILIARIRNEWRSVIFINEMSLANHHSLFDKPILSFVTPYITVREFFNFLVSNFKEGLEGKKLIDYLKDNQSEEYISLSKNYAFHYYDFSYLFLKDKNDFISEHNYFSDFFLSFYSKADELRCVASSSLSYDVFSIENAWKGFNYLCSSLISQAEVRIGEFSISSNEASKPFNINALDKIDSIYDLKRSSRLVYFQISQEHDFLYIEESIRKALKYFNIFNAALNYDLVQSSFSWDILPGVIPITMKKWEVRSNTTLFLKKIKSHYLSLKYDSGASVFSVEIIILIDKSYVLLNAHSLFLDENYLIDIAFALHQKISFSNVAIFTRRRNQYLNSRYVVPKIEIDKVLDFSKLFKVRTETEYNSTLPHSDRYLINFNKNGKEYRKIFINENYSFDYNSSKLIHVFCNKNKIKVSHLLLLGLIEVFASYEYGKEFYIFERVYTDRLSGFFCETEVPHLLKENLFSPDISLEARIHLLSALLEMKDYSQANWRRFYQFHGVYLLFEIVDNSNAEAIILNTFSPIERDRVFLKIIIEKNDGIRFELSYFLDDFISHDFFERFKVELLKSIHRKKRELPEKYIFLIEKDKKILSLLSSKNEQMYFTDAIYSIFSNQVRLNKNKPCIKHGETAFTYNSFYNLVEKVVFYLVSQGFSKQKKAILYTSLDCETIALVFAMIRIGIIYIPIDRHYPIERVNLIIEESNADLIITDFSIIDELNSNKAILLPVLVEKKSLFLKLNDCSISEIEIENVCADDDIYILYTSGSTGKPKGARVTHGGFFNLLKWFTTEFNDLLIVNYLISSFGFDLTQKNIFSPLLSGGTLVLPKERRFDPEEMRNVLSKEKINFINCAPSQFYSFIDYLEHRQDFSSLHSIKVLVLGGEKFDLFKIKRWIVSDFFYSDLVNSYGPTECTDVVSFYRLSHGQVKIFIKESIFANKKSNFFPIGLPIPNVFLFIVDKNLRCLPPNRVGELLIGGIAVGKGYVDSSNNDVFINNPFGSDKVYRTGDLVYQDLHGLLHYVSRNDSQVKIHGVRIEILEIEKTILLFKNIKSCVVLAYDNHIIAFIEFFSFENNSEPLSSFLRKMLPSFMLPSALYPLKEWPINAHGKIDRAELINKFNRDKKKKNLLKSDQNVTLLKSNIKYQNEVVAAWRKILSRQDISAQDDIFNKGAHSVHILKIISIIKSELNIEVPVRYFFEFKKISEFCYEIAKISFLFSETKFLKADRDKINHFNLSYDQKRIWYAINQSEYLSAYNIVGMLNIHGELDLKIIPKVIHELIEKHEALCIILDANQPIQKLNKNQNWLLNIQDLSLDEQKNEILDEIINKEKNRIFSLFMGPLWSFSIIKMSDNDFVWVINIHHIIVDGWSVINLANDFFEIYCDLFRLKESCLSAVKSYDFIDYIYTFYDEKYNENEIKTFNYWANFFLTYKNHYQFPSIISGENFSSVGFLNFDLAPSLSSELSSFCFSNNVSCQNVCLTAFAWSLYQYSDHASVYLHTIYSGRDHSEIQSMVGFFIRMIFISFSFDENWFLIDLIKSVEAQWIESLRYQALNVESLLSHLNKSHHLKTLPGAEISFIWQGHIFNSLGASFEKFKAQGLSVNYNEISLKQAKNDLMLILTEGDLQHISGVFEFRKIKFTQEIIEDIKNNFIKNIDNLLNQSRLTISTINYLPFISNDYFSHEKIIPLGCVQRDILFGELKGRVNNTHEYGVCFTLNNENDLFSMVTKTTDLSEFFYWFFSCVCEVKNAESMDSFYCLRPINDHKKWLYYDHTVYSYSYAQEKLSDWLDQPCVLSEESLFKIKYMLINEGVFVAIKTHLILLDYVSFNDFVEKFIVYIKNKDRAKKVVDFFGAVNNKDYFDKFIYTENQFNSPSTLSFWKELSVRSIYSLPLLAKNTEFFNCDIQIPTRHAEDILSFCHKNNIDQKYYFFVIYALAIKLLFNVNENFLIGWLLAFNEDKSHYGSYLSICPVLVDQHFLKSESDENFFVVFCRYIVHKLKDASSHAFISPFSLKSLSGGQDLAFSMAIFDQSNNLTPFHRIFFPKLNQCNLTVIFSQKSFHLHLSLPASISSDHYILSRIESLSCQLLQSNQDFSLLDLWLPHENKSFSFPVTSPNEHTSPNECTNNSELMDQPLSDFSLFFAANCIQTYLNSSHNFSLLACGSRTVSSQSFANSVLELVFLLKKKGMHSGSKIAISLPYSIDWFIAIWAVVSLGGTYIPIDFSLPIKRKQLILHNMSANALIINNEESSFLVEKSTLQLVVYFSQNKFYYHDFESAETSSLSSLLSSLKQQTTYVSNSILTLPNFIRSEEEKAVLYYIYTSGSTGIPKAAGVTYASFDQLLLWYGDIVSQIDEPVFLIASHFSFDLTQKNLFIPILLRAKCIIPEKYPLDVEELIKLIYIHKVKIINLSPSVFYGILDCCIYENTLDKTYEKIQSLECIILGGEPVNCARLLSWMQWKKSLGLSLDIRFINSYGPTECTDVVCAYHFDADDIFNLKSIPLGQALPYVSLYVFNTYGQCLPPGYKGELFIGGKAVGVGYWDNEKLNKEKFIEHSDFGLLYKTGDWVIEDEQNNLNFLGRIDYQIKLRGLRIELSEIECALKLCQGVKEAVCKAINNSLIAYIQADDCYDQHFYREALASSLPGYMIPDVFTFLSAWPLTVNGKIDRHLLPEPENKIKDFILPEGQKEKIIYDLFRSLLGVSELSTEDDFFELGGHSILAIRLLNSIKKTFSFALPLSFIFETRTIKKMASALETLEYLTLPVTSNHIQQHLESQAAGEGDFEEFDI